MISRESDAVVSPAITTLVPWYGNNRMLSEHVGAALAGCEWVGVPFLGGGPELLHIKARTIVANDLHSQLINLAKIAGDPLLGPELYRELRRVPFHSKALAEAQVHCLWAESRGPSHEASYVDALNYFIACWMGRSANAGTEREFAGGLPIRWDAGGGDSAVRYHSAVRSLRDWRKVLARCNFTAMDVFKFLEKCKDALKHGLYCDPPFPGPGDKYKHRFTVEQHHLLAAKLAAYTQTRVVCRFYEHDLIAELYPETRWRWIRLEGRTQSNGTSPEVLITNEREELLF